MLLFPCGTINSSNSTATLDHITYKIFEPNEGSTRKNTYYNLVSAFDTKIMSSRQKAEPTLSIEYRYSNIFNKEYRQIEHFVKNRKAELNSFFVVDWSSGYTPSTVASLSGKWQIVSDYMLDYSATTNMKSNYAMLWDGLNHRIGNVATVNSATRITVSKDYGDLSLSKAQTDANVYPIYEVRFTPSPLNSFSSSEYIGGSLSTSEFGGSMYSGTLAFISKYKVE